jgi:hypothetical protein
MKQENEKEKGLEKREETKERMCKYCVAFACSLMCVINLNPKIAYL